MGALDGKIAIITGGTSGIGESAAEVFIAEGATVIVSGRRRDVGEALATRLGQNASFVQCDVALEGEVKALIDGTVARFGRLDCLFANAGFGITPTSITELDMAEYDRLMATLVRGVVLGMKYAGKVMMAQGSGSIINTASVAGYTAGGSSHSYSAAKAAVIHFTKCVAAELGEHGVRVNSISPGAIVTGIFGKGMGLDHGAADRAIATLKAGFAKAQPIPRAGMPEDIARAAVYLASDAASFVNGIDLVVDGGLITGQRFSQALAGRNALRAGIQAEVDKG